MSALPDPHRSPSPAPPAEAEAVVAFWREAGPDRWFKKDAAFDASFRERFLALHERAAQGELLGWLATATGTLALILLLDQFPRNAFRGTARLYATDTLARGVANAAIIAGHDLEIEPALRVFVYLPLEHAEDLKDQERSVALTRPLGEELLKYAELHRDIIKRFGRFPHRNAVLSRATTEEEQRWLDEGGFKG